MEACLPPRLNGLGAGPYAWKGAVRTMASDARRDLCGTCCLGETGVRRVNEDDAALALRALDQNGVTIASTANRGDVPEILAGVGDPDLEAWLETGSDPAVRRTPSGMVERTALREGGASRRADGPPTGPERKGMLP